MTIGDDHSSLGFDVRSGSRSWIKLMRSTDRGLDQEQFLVIHATGGSRLACVAPEIKILQEIEAF